MANVALLFSLIIFVLGLIVEPKKINPITVFYGEWSIIIYLAKLNLYSLIPAKDSTYGMMLLGLVTFFTGYIFTIEILQNTKIKLRLKKNDKESNNHNKQIIINKKNIYILLAFTLLICIINSTRSIISLLQGNTLSVIREAAQDNTLYSNNKLMNALQILVINPVSFAVAPLAAMEIYKKKRNLYLIILPVLIVLLRVIGDGGRSPLIFLILCIILCYFYQGRDGLKRNKITLSSKIIIQKKFKYFAIILIVAFIVLWRITLSRSGNNTIRYTYYYFAMEPTMFEKWAAITDNNKLYGFGMASFNGFLFPLFYIISNIFNVGYPVAWRNIYDLIESVGTDWQVITHTGLTANSYASVFWNLYLDGRVFGIAFGMFVYGAFIAYFYNQILKDKQTEKSLALFCIIMLGLFYSFQFIIFENFYYALGFLFIQFIFYKETYTSQ